jgi:hypothetical protein
MPHFASEQDVYEQIGKLFEEQLADAEVATALKQADTIVQYRYREPEATVTLDVRANAEPRVDLGATELEPEVVISMNADTAHALSEGRVNVTVALASGEIRTKGPIAKILKLIGLARPKPSQ